MAKRKQQQPPTTSAHRRPPDIYILDRFTARDLDTWAARSKDLDELIHRLYFALEPERIAKRSELIEAISRKPAAPFSFENWVRILPYRYSLQPLSATGSLRRYGGRFNIGNDVEHSIPKPFPALYLGENYETAYCEYNQIQKDTPGLTAEDLSLEGSTTTVILRGHIERVLDVTDPYALAPIANVLSKIRMPLGIDKILRRLKERPDSVWMIRRPSDLLVSFGQNWRAWPIQFGIPSVSQQFAELALAAGYEAIRYRSTKNSGGLCLAIFPSNIENDKSFVEIVDSAPTGVTCRLDATSADELCGWDCLPSSRRR